MRATALRFSDAANYDKVHRSAGHAVIRVCGGMDRRVDSDEGAVSKSPMLPALALAAVDAISSKSTTAIGW